jgi:restriction endonuclease S subunit
MSGILNAGCWNSTQLRELCEVIPGRHIVEENYNRNQRGVPYLTGPSDFGSQQATASRWTEKPDVMCAPNDVLVTVKGAGVAKVNFAPPEPACIGRQLMAIRARPGKTNATFVFFALQWAQEQLKSQATGATVPGLSIEDLEALHLPNPPSEKHEPIAACLLEQLKKVERARAAVAAQLQAAENLPTAFLRGVLSTLAAQQWPRLPFGKIVENFDGIRVPLKQSDRAKRQGEFPYYGASGIIDQIDAFIFDGDFLLVAEDGANLVARSTPIAFKASGKFWVNNHAHVVQPKAGVLLEFLEHFFAAADIRDFVTGSAQPKLSQGSLNAIPVPVPPMEKQRQICSQLAAELSGVTTLRDQLEQKLATVEKIPTALLRSAFRSKI